MINKEKAAKYIANNIITSDKHKEKFGLNQYLSDSTKEGFKEFGEKIKKECNEYIHNYNLNFIIKDSQQDKKKYFIQLVDTDETLDYSYVHYEFLFDEKKAGVYLHLEYRDKTKNEKTFNIIKPALNSTLISKVWGNGYSIQSGKSINMDDDNRIEQLFENLNNLHNAILPLLKKHAMTESLKPIVDLLEYKKQIILQGPPGTGKTRLAKQIVNSIIGTNHDLGVGMPITITKDDIIRICVVGSKVPSVSGKTEYEIASINKESITLNTTEGTQYNCTFDTIIESYKSKKWESKQINGHDPYYSAITKYIFENSEVIRNVNEGYSKLVQFHPSYTYEDFVRGIVTESKGDRIEYKTVNKTLGEFAKSAYLNWVQSKRGIEYISEEIWLEEQYLNFKNEIEIKLINQEIVLLKENLAPRITAVEDDAIRCNRYNNPNDSVLLKDRDIIYGYLGMHSIPSMKIKDNANLTKSARSGMYYLYQNLIEKFDTYLKDNQLEFNLAENTSSNTLKNYILIIDEINRANLSSVLGELIYALEYREDAVESMYKVDDDNKLVLPPNLYIIGTMNTADRSVGHIDYAIRRRFAFVDVLPKNLSGEKGIIFDSTLFEQVSSLFVKGFDLQKDYSKEKIEPANTLSEEFDPKDVWLGHSYFIDKTSEGGNMQMRLDYEIKPILREYVKDGVLIGDDILGKIKDLKVGI